MCQYRQAWKDAHGYFSLNMVSSRGCPYRCNWCAKPIYGNRYHARPAWSVAAEMLYLKTEFQPDRIWFADDIFALSPKWTFAFADAVESLGAQVPFKMQSRCDLMTRDTVEALRLAGCAEVWMGAESGSQRILDAMDKGTRVKDICRARENLRRHGIRACFFLQFGYPGETRSEIEETIRMVRETQPDDIGVSVSYPLPGTRFYEQVRAQLGHKSNWTDSADLAMVFRGEYPSEFYRALADALHAEVRGGFHSDAAAWDRVWELERSHSSGRASTLGTTPFPVLRESPELAS
jgi:anaerobic magnesium-protoporphyrin IX monomethyl ester cyclase